MAFLTLNTARNYFNARLHETPVLLSKCAEAIKNQSLFIAYNNINNTIIIDIRIIHQVILVIIMHLLHLRLL